MNVDGCINPYPDRRNPQVRWDVESFLTLRRFHVDLELWRGGVVLARPWVGIGIGTVEVPVPRIRTQQGAVIIDQTRNLVSEAVTKVQNQ